MLVDDNPLRLP